MLELGQNWLIAQGLDSPLADMLVRSAIGVVILLMAWISGVVARRIVLRLIAKLVATSKTHWDDIFLEHGVLDHLVRLVPALVLQVLTNIPLAGYETALRIVHTAIDIYMLAITILVLDATLNAVLHIFRQSPASKKFSLKSFIQICEDHHLFSDWHPHGFENHEHVSDRVLKRPWSNDGNHTPHL